ncbi:uncharacterized protein F5Z01DRAFT_697538 [Emericellopsis atlantica]|uniref:Uncharacterized protein n=1 Tax=Emericellopsis atlantica TaxID=2614577 RepID=A0A9P8CRH6_9HYPO|nr:uncharacterized protein F5Z01DRAFT_697538 [Emericellopsis atlantica]KAG9256738.1 hypothetical protein F5Z01DRAFT_697538 [Emericellopsis atlantica]
MVLEQTITIGKQLLSVFNQAKGAYQEKKAQIKSERSTLGRAQTFDHHPTTSRSVYRHHDPYDYDDYYDEEEDEYYDKYYDEPPIRRHSVYDGHSEASSRRTARTSSRRNPRDDRSVVSRRTALTASNLKTLSEVSSAAPSRAPRGYRPPYAETLNKDMAVSRMNLTHADMRSIAPSERRPPTAMTRRRSFSEVSDRRAMVNRPGGKHIDMDLAYGDVPPDLQDRVDLDPDRSAEAKEQRAKMLVKKVESLLDEAHCVQHSASATISHLQQNPDAAAAVALSLAELSTLVTKMSPAFLGFIKGGSPAVFALLASPQFLIGTAAVVGVTVVMFGGWKIVKKVKEQQAAREAIAFEGVPMDRPAPKRTQSDFSTGMDEAYIIDDDISSIDSWRRGILPEFGENESVDMELITPEARRANRSRMGKEDDFDTKSRRSTKTTKTSKTSKTSKPKEREVPERKSSKHATTESVAGSERSRKPSSSKRKEKTTVRAIEDGRSRRGDDDGIEMVFRPKGQKQTNMLKALFKTNKERERELVHVR